MKKTSIITAALVLSSSLSGFAKTETCDWPAVKKLKSGNLVSTYTFDFWSFAKNNLPSYFKNTDLLESGPVVGDFHFNNVGIYYNKTAQKVDLAVIDLDDSGQASFLADYLKFISYLKTITDSLDQKELLKNYVDGLSANDITKPHDSMPDGIADLFKKKEDWFSDKNDKAAKNKMNSSQTAFSKKEDLKNVSQLNPSLKSLVSSLSSKMNVLDSGYKINGSGSSMGSLRIEVLGSEQKEIGLYEFKELRCPGTELYQEQKNQSDRFEEMKHALKSEDFWSSSFISSAVVEENTEQTFLFRRKQENALQDLDIDHMKKDKLMEYSKYYAFVLGYFHGKVASKEYKNALDKNSDKLIKAIDQFSTDYLKQLKKRTKD